MARDGRALYAANVRSGTLHRYAVDPATGAMTAGEMRAARSGSITVSLAINGGLPAGC
jgi:6-phosphogluconolactonase (cycloisomerase 2 family)